VVLTPPARVGPFPRLKPGATYGNQADHR
jgi:hypothetical protein